MRISAENSRFFKGLLGFIVINNGEATLHRRTSLPTPHICGIGIQSERQDKEMENTHRCTAREFSTSPSTSIAADAISRQQLKVVRDQEPESCAATVL